MRSGDALRRDDPRPTSNIAVADFGDEDGRTRFELAVRNPSADAVAALDLLDQERAEREAEAARRAARERKERAERVAAAAQKWEEWVAGLDDGLDRDAVVAAASGLTTWINTDQPLGVYRREQLRRAQEWARTRLAGYRPGLVVDHARQRYTVAEDAGTLKVIAQAYTEAENSRINNAAQWDEPARRRTQLGRRRRAGNPRPARRRRVRGSPASTPRRWSSPTTSTTGPWRGQRSRRLPTRGTPRAQAAERIIEGWGGTRHGGDALAVLRQRYRPPQREAQNGAAEALTSAGRSRAQGPGIGV